MSLVLLSAVASGQKLTGKVLDSQGAFIEGANVYWLKTEINTLTDNDGNFSILKTDSSNTLIISFVGYIADTIEVGPATVEIHVRLKDIINLNEVNVRAKRFNTSTSTIQTRNVESVTSCELKNAPCCSLSESFVTNGTVDVVQTDAATGTKEIQMLGLKGIYTQTLIENRPDLSGIASSYALDYIPGSWVESIQISKGASTVANGFNSITGQINVELVKPFKDKAFYVNAFGNHEGRYEANMHINKKFTPQLSSGLLLHTSGQQYRGDHDHDGFIDNVLRTTYTGLYRIYYNGSKYTGQLNFHFVDDKRLSGEYVHDHNLDTEETFYHIQQNNRRYDLFGKFAFLGFKGANETMGFLWHAIKHELNNKIHLRELNAQQTDLLATLLYKNSIGSDPSHMINIGVTAQMDKTDQQFDDQFINYDDRQVGGHAEYTFEPSAEMKEGTSFLKNFGLIAGVRLDHHSDAGWLFTPRLNLKYNLSDESIIRLSAGRGLRRARPFTDNINQTINNKTWIVEPNLKLEDAWNFGGNFTQNFTLAGKSGQINIDAYRVIFKNQVILDPDVDPTKVFIYSLDGTSYSNTLLLGLQYEVLTGLTAKIAYKYSDVKLDYLEGFRSQIFIPKNRGLFTLLYTTPDSKWSFSFISAYTGIMRLPDVDGIPPAILHGASDKSESFYRLDFQVTRFWKNFEVYAGVENLTGYRQSHAILEHDLPTGDYFDAGRIYGPLNDQLFNIGFRFWIE